MSYQHDSTPYEGNASQGKIYPTSASKKEGCISHTESFLCPLCGGHDRLERGQGTRCSGFTSADLAYTQCDRVASPKKGFRGLNIHFMQGACECGATHGTLKPTSTKQAPTTTYAYVNESGSPLYYVTRSSTKGFKQWHKDTQGKAVYNLNGVRRVLYNLPKVLQADTVYIVEGEKCAQALTSAGVTTTTSPMGAGKWKDEYCKFLVGKHIVLLPDNDTAGRDHMQQVQASLVADGRVLSLKYIELYTTGETKEDIADWLASGNTLAQLQTQVAQAPIIFEKLKRKFTYASEVKEEKVEWLWKRRFAQGLLTLVVGDPGLGKSLLMAKLIAAVTTGGMLPDNTTIPARTVILMATEDMAAQTIVPRLRAVGADLTKVLLLAEIEDVGTDGTRYDRPLSFPGDAAILEEAMVESNAALVVIDPLMGVIDGKHDAHKDQDVRNALARVLAIAKARQCAVAGIMHLNKNQGGAFINRAGGSKAFTALARIGLGVVVDPDNENGGVVFNYKNNLASKIGTASLCYRFDQTPDEIGYVEWNGESAHSQEELEGTRSSGDTTRSAQSNEIVDLLQASESDVSIADIAAALPDTKEATLRKMVERLADGGYILRTTRGRYTARGRKLGIEESEETPLNIIPNNNNVVSVVKGNVSDMSQVSQTETDPHYPTVQTAPNCSHLYHGGEEPTENCDIETFATFATSVIGMSQSDCKLTPQLAQLETITSALQPEIKNFLALDIETTGLDPRTDRIVSLQLAIAGHAPEVLDLRPYYLASVEAQKIFSSRLQSLLNREDTRVVGHNLKFDLSFLLEVFGARVSQVYDTMLAEIVLNNGKSSGDSAYYSLKATAKTYGIDLDKEEQQSTVGIDALDGTRVPDGELGHLPAWSAPFTLTQRGYMERDVTSVLTIRSQQLPHLMKQGLVQALQLDLQALPMIVEMEVHGALVDLQALAEVTALKEQKRDALEAEILPILEPAYNAAKEREQAAANGQVMVWERALADQETLWKQTYDSGSVVGQTWKQYLAAQSKQWKGANKKPKAMNTYRPFSVSSPTALLLALQEVGVPVSGTNAGALEAVASVHPVVGKLLEWKNEQAIVTGFCTPIAKHTGTDGRLHPDYHLVKSGRYVTEKPNFQAIPKLRNGWTEAEDPRRCIVAPAGSALVIADLPNIELRILAELSRDKVMLQAFADGEDLHASTARAMFHLPVGTDTKKHLVNGISARAIAKMINFGLAYGMGASTLAMRLGITEEQAKAHIDAYRKTYRGLTNYLYKSGREAIDRGYAVSVGGRKRYYPIGQHYFDNSAKNHPIQGTNADILKRALYKLYTYLQDTRIYVIAIVHDEIVLEAPADMVDFAKELLQAALHDACTDFLKIVAIPEIEVESSAYWTK